MLEFIINLAWTGLLILITIALKYYLFMESLKESVRYGLYIGILVTSVAIRVYYKFHYQPIVIVIGHGIAVFLLTSVYDYYVLKLSLKRSVKNGLFVGIMGAVFMVIDV